MTITLLQFFALTFTGLLAGAELIVRYGIHPAIAGLDDRSHIAARVSLVRRLRWLVPLLMLPALALQIAGHAIGVWAPQTALYAWAALAALTAFFLLAFFGTVPINMMVSDWSVDAPPTNWKAIVAKWAQIDIFRSTAAIVSFIALIAGCVFGR